MKYKINKNGITIMESNDGFYLQGIISSSETIDLFLTKIELENFLTESKKSLNNIDMIDLINIEL